LTLKNKLLELASGSTFLEVSPNKIKNLLIPLPPLNEQIAIANILSGLDRYLYSLDALILKKESVKKALSFELLSQITMLLEDFKAVSGGNIGTPLIELFEKQSPLWVLETSSFSLHYTNKAYPLIYLLINIEADHLTWHCNFENYLNAKL
ncbi:restriction endonuclease subunit S, partial [Helicobacter pylori]|uniref:restriction endonuclease subunit S n=1 Tax=Helicobacter pylori TaxID=210 RepID=UPI002711F177